MSAVSDSVRPHRRQPTRLRRPWDSPGKNTGVGCHFLLQCLKVKSENEVTQSCPTLRDPTDCSPPDSSIHGIFQARVLELGVTAFSCLGYTGVRTQRLKERSATSFYTVNHRAPGLGGRQLQVPPIPSNFRGNRSRRVHRQARLFTLVQILEVWAQIL